MTSRFELLAVLLLCASGCTNREARVNDVLALTGDRQHGSEIFATVCSECHAAVTGQCWATRAMVVNATVYGWKGGSMPPQDSLSEQDLADVAAFLSASCAPVDAGLGDAGTVDGGVDGGSDAGH
ncbi:MAG: c-type cytochrome [Myxococcaceae bacterium]